MALSFKVHVQFQVTSLGKYMYNAVCLGVPWGPTLIFFLSPKGGVYIGVSILPGRGIDTVNTII